MKKIAENSTLKDYSADKYTLKAQVKLRNIEANEKLQEMIRNGDQSLFDSIINNAVEYQLTFGDHIKRYIYDTSLNNYISIEDITYKEMKSYIKKAFCKNGMKNRGSISPSTATTLESQLDKWLQSPIVKIKRQTCFLFAFGLNMNEEETEYFLTYVLRQATFNVRDPQEAIYYYCLRKNQSYEKLVQWVNIYKNLPVNMLKKRTETLVLQEDFYEITEDTTEEEFLNYLKKIKNQPADKKKSLSRAKELKDLITQVSFALSNECKKSLRKNIVLQAVGYEDEGISLDTFEKLLKSKAQENAEIPMALEELLTNKLIEIPAFSGKSLDHKISQRNNEITREDILMATFLLETCDMDYDFKTQLEDSKKEGKSIYQKRKAEFMLAANETLEECGFCEVSLLSPFELFLVACLLKEEPMKYFLGVWKKYRGN